MPLQYFSVFTTLGLQRLAEAQANATPLVFTHVAVGDGNGAPITPSAGMTALVHERARVMVNNVELVLGFQNQVRVEGLLPSGTGGFTIREAGLFNGAGELIAIASYPPIYKPVPGDGITVEEYIRIILFYETVDAVALTVDTSNIVATQLDVAEAKQQLTDVVIKDHFIGNAIDASTWIKTGTNMTVIDDHANEGSGALRIPATVGEATEGVSTQPFVIGDRDFRCEARVRASDMNVHGTFIFGILDGGGWSAYFRSISTQLSGRWAFLHGGGPTVLDTGASPSGDYQVLVVERVSGVLSASLNGVVIFTGALTSDFNESVLTLQVGYISANATLVVDYVTLSIGGAWAATS